MIVQATRALGGLIENARWEIEDQIFSLGQEYLFVMNVPPLLMEKVKKSVSKDVSMYTTETVGLMFHVSRIRCVHDIPSGIRENVIFVEANQPRVEGLFLELLPAQDSSSSGTKED